MVDRARLRHVASQPSYSQGATRWPSIPQPPMLHRRSPARSARRRARAASASNICSPPRKIESNLNPAAQASTSSAKGLYQFIEQTWLGTMKGKRAGERLWPLCRRHFPLAGWTLRGGRSGHARGHHAAAQRSGRERDDGRRLHPRQCRTASRRDRPSADRRRALHRAFPRLRRRGQN